MFNAIVSKNEFEQFLKENSISEQRSYLQNHPNEEDLIAQYANSYLTSRSLSKNKDLRLKAWLLLPKKMAQKINFTDEIEFLTNTKQEMLKIVVQTRDFWRIKKLEKWGIVDLQEEGADLIHEACKEESLDSIKKLLKLGIPIDARNEKGETLLEAALLSYRPSNKVILEFLINSGAAVNQKNEEGQTLIHQSLLADPPIEIEILKLLLDKGANINQKNNKGQTPLRQAIKLSSSIGKEVFKLLLSKGADINITDKNGDNILHTALIGNLLSEEIIQLFIDYDADIYSLNNFGESCDFILKSQDINVFTKKIDDPIKELITKERENELLLRRLLASSWSIKRETEFEGKSFKLEEIHGTTTGQIKAIELLNKFKNLSANFINVEEACSLIEKSYQRSRNNSKEKISEQFNKGKTLIFSTGWKGHAIQVTFMGSYMLISNRGSERKDASIVAFKIDRQKKLDLRDIEFLTTRTLVSQEKGPEYFYEELPVKLGYNSQKKDLICKIIEKKCRLSVQKIENCWWISPKTGTLGILAMQNLLEASMQTFNSKGERKKAYEKIFDSSQAIYKYYSEFAPLQILKEYLERPIDRAERDHVLIYDVSKKIHSKSWKYIFEKKSIMDHLYSYISEILWTKTKKALPPLYSKDEVENWLMDYREKYNLDENFMSNDAETSLMYIL